MSEQIDYETVTVPPEKDRSEFSYSERRADQFGEIRDAGYPDLIDKSGLAEQYDVSPSTITNDLDVLASYISAGLSDRHSLQVEAVFSRALRELIEDEEWRQAARTAGEYSDWVHGQVELRHLHERVAELSGRAEAVTRIDTERFRHQ